MHNTQTNSQLLHNTQTVSSCTTHKQTVSSCTTHKQAVSSCTTHKQIVSSCTTHKQTASYCTTHKQAVSSCTKHKQTVSSCTTHKQTVSKFISSYTAQPLFQSRTAYPDRVCDAGAARESALVVRDAVVPRRRDDERELVVVGVCRHTLLLQTLGYTGDQNHSQVHGVECEQHSLISARRCLRGTH